MYKRSTSFTLLEVLVVVTIISSLIFISLPRFRGTFNSLQFQNFCQNLLSRMRYLNERASVEQRVYRLNFNLHAARVEIVSKKHPREDTFDRVAHRLGKSISIPKGIEIEADSLVVFFLPDGSITGNDITICDSQKSVTLKINNSLGRISLEENE